MPTRGTPPTLADIGAASLRDDDGPAASLDETRWAVSRLSILGLERLSTFLTDLAARAPLDGPAWEPHRLVIEALESDIQRERAKRDMNAEGTNNGTGPHIPGEIGNPPENGPDD